MTEVKVNVDRDSGMHFYISSQPVYGRAQVAMPQEFFLRFQRVYDEFEDCQIEMRKYWDASQNVRKDPQA